MIALVLLLACPLLMVFLHRGGHAHHSHTGHHPYGAGHDNAEGGTLAELRRRREQLEAEIARLEGEERELSGEAAERAGAPALVGGAGEGRR